MDTVTLFRPLRAEGTRAHPRVEEHPESFGNALIVLDSRQYSLRIVSDKERVFLDVKEAGDEPDRWYSLSRILTLEGLRPNEGPWQTPQTAVDALERHAASAVPRLGLRCQQLAGRSPRRPAFGHESPTPPGAAAPWSDRAGVGA